MKKLNSRIDSLNNELRAAKRKLSSDSGGGGGNQGSAKRHGKHKHGARQPNSKGKGKGKHADMAGFNKKFQGEPICFNYNRPGGCTVAAPGAKCTHGWHVCIKCHSRSHALGSPDCRS